MTKNYSVLHAHTKFSNLDGFSSPEDNIVRAKELGINLMSISDHGNVTGHIDMANAAKKHDMRFGLGCELYISHQNAYERSHRSNSHFVVTAKDSAGLLNLWKLTSRTNDAEYYYYKPRIHLFSHTDSDGKFREGLDHFVNQKNILGISGHQGSLLANALFCDVLNDSPEEIENKLNLAYAQKKGEKTEYFKQFLHKDWLKNTSILAEKLASMFGEENFRIELQNELNEKDALPLYIHNLIVDCLRETSKQTGIKCFPASDPHYARKELAKSQRHVLMISAKETESSVKEKLEASDDMFVFFGSDEFYIKSYNEMATKFSPEELEETNTFCNQIQKYDIFKDPQVPKIDIPVITDKLPAIENCIKDNDKYLLKIAIDGAKKMKPWEKTGITKEKYWERLKHEMSIICKYNVTDYILVVSDFMMAGNRRPKDHSFDWKNWKGEIDPVTFGCGRGSVGASLVCYFVGIHFIDPLEYDLLFSRFFNEARAKDLMDVDTDISKEDRNWVIGYIEQKYGSDHVGQIVTMGKIMGRSALRDILRVKDITNGVEIANQLAVYIPNESEISEDLEEARVAGHEIGVLEWTRENSKKFVEESEELGVTEVIDSAIELEGCYRNVGRHASGFIISSDRLEDSCPLLLDNKNKKKIVSFTMKDISKIGKIKVDLLGLALLDKIKMCTKLIKENK